MGKRKQRPEPPKHFWLDTDGCWFCKNRKSCAGCKVLKRYIAEKTSQRKIKRDEKRFFDFS